MPRFSACLLYGLAWGVCLVGILISCGSCGFSRAACSEESSMIPLATTPFSASAISFSFCLESPVTPGLPAR